MTAGIPIHSAPDRPNEHFTVIGNANVRNGGETTLTGLAMALHHYLLSLPPDWKITPDQIAEDVFPLDSRERVRQAVRELRNAGLLTLHRERRPGGAIIRSWYQAFHNPQPAEARTPSRGRVTSRRDPGVKLPPAETPSFPRSELNAGKPAAGIPAGNKKTDSEDCKKTRSKDRSPDGPRSQAKAARDSDDQILEDVRAAIAAVYGEQENTITEDENALWLWEALKPQDGRVVRHRRAYLEKIFSDTPDLDSIYARYGSSYEYDETAGLDPLKPCPRCVADGRETMIAEELDVCSRCEWDLLALSQHPR